LKGYDIKDISTLVQDVQEVLNKGLEVIPPETVQRFMASAGGVTNKLKVHPVPSKFTLRFSNIGKPCVRRLWLESRHYNDKVEHSADNGFKFALGDLAEEYLIFLIELAGHKVELRQHEVTLAGIKGHIDAVVDGMLLDVKSASSFAFKKFKEGLTEETDDFGYLTQLAAYFQEMRKLPEVTDKTRAGFLVFDKTHGNIHLDIHEFSDLNLEDFFEERKEIIKSNDVPDRAYKTKLDGYKKDKVLVPNGNEYLGSPCTWCPMKFKCYPGLRVFQGWDGPKYFTKIIKPPKMLEITENYAEDPEVSIDE
jgi:hypothetical protein